jgi:hypothetical protein
MTTKTPKRPPRQNVEDEVLTTAHGLASALHRVGAMDEPSPRTMDHLYPRPNPTTEVRR